jgi:hypothetical protein
MVTSKIILLLRRMGKNELARFREFLASPYFNHKPKLGELYDNLLRYAPEFDPAGINKTKIYESLYPGSRFNAQVYKNLSSELYSLAGQFIAINNFNVNDVEKDLYFIKELERIGADELYQSELKQLKKKLNENKFNELLFFNKFTLATTERTFFFNRSDFKKAFNIDEESDELMKFYFIQLFRQRFDFEAAGLNFNVQQDENAAMRHMSKLMEKGVIEDTIDHMSKKKTKNHEIVAMFYYILMSFKYTDNDLFFNKAKELAFSNIHKFDNNQRFSVSGALYGLCTFRLRLRGNRSDYQDTFDVINFRLNKKIYKDSPDSPVSAISFRAMFMTGMYLNKLDWAKKFLKKYIGEVTPEHGENLNNLLTAFIKFYEKKFDESLEYSSLVKYDISLYKLDVRKLQLFNYYELGHMESALSLISSFREFLGSNKNLTGDERTKHLKLLKYTAKLIKLKNKFNEFELRKLEKDIKESGYLLYRWWLKEKTGLLRSENKKMNH